MVEPTLSAGSQGKTIISHPWTVMEELGVFACGMLLIVLLFLCTILEAMGL